ncbi:hypothetical protein KDL01_08430 [Actinospica durhamensis]|uniref:Uncharacterized protein n=1 Tax=Actinospica durhamensis TaxID=1508375 RepID=A0A941EQI8_9ACTN|nr:hypothetical protein [Actinospica durhamensis]MBR7833289.1 hypothetical protein [Actinospica durhamensis]
MSDQEMPVRQTAVFCALALAAHYFPLAVPGDARTAAPFDKAAFELESIGSTTARAIPWSASPSRSPARTKDTRRKR